MPVIKRQGVQRVGEVLGEEREIGEVEVGGVVSG